MIAGEHHDPSTLELSWWAMTLAGGDPDRQILEPAQGAGGFGEQVLAAPGCGTRTAIGGSHLGELSQEIRHRFTQIGWPATTSTTSSQYGASR